MEENIRIDLSQLYPEFATKIPLLISNCRKAGANYFATAGYRSIQEQNDLFALGRTKVNPDGKSAEKPMGNVVTKARGGESWHNYGLAVDFTYDRLPAVKGLQPRWRDTDYLILAREAEKLGLEAGLRWKFKDAPHIQWPADIDLKTAIALQTRTAVWAALRA